MDEQQAVESTVKQFLDSHTAASSTRADLLFDNLSVQGSGRGVSLSTWRCVVVYTG